MLSLSFSESTGSITPRRVRKRGVDLEFMERITFLGVKSYSMLSLSFSESTVSISPRTVRKSGVDLELVEKMKVLDMKS